MPVKTNKSVSGRGKRRQQHIGLADRLCLSVREAAEMLGLSTNNLYELIRKHKIPVIELGKRKLIPRVQLEKMLEGGKTNEGTHSETGQ